MYFAIVFLFMFFLPILSMTIEYFGFHNSEIVFLIGKWFVFWAVGIRFFTASIRQITKPEFTANEILGSKDKSIFIIVRELGFSNFAISIIAIGSLFIQNWLQPAALVGAIFLGLAGIYHVIRGPVTKMEWIALLSNLFVSIVLIVFLLLSII